MAVPGKPLVRSSLIKTKINTAPLVFNDDLNQMMKKSKLLVVGAGGIGCELLKNLVLTGFEDIEIIDLDTIDVSNLNRQFLFQKKHVGMSKASVARESVLRFNGNAKIVAHHGSITSQEFGVGFIAKFNVVLSALDNRAARSHLNRICLATGIPLVESGTEGYSGQVELIVKEMTKCYECSPKPAGKTFPGCTIRNTPSEHIHCIVWAKHLFNQLFGHFNPKEEDEDVSPDPTDIAAGVNAHLTRRMTTRSWAKEVNYAPGQLFEKLFNADIKMLLTMSDLWETRKPPTPLCWTDIIETTEEENLTTNTQMSDQKVWTLQECANIFAESLAGLKEAMASSEHGHLEWDKDDKNAMNFVAATSNIRAHIFAIKNKSKFEIKAMAGNIIPAIATSNAVIAGLIVLNALNILRNKLDQCQPVYLRKLPNARGGLLVREKKHEKPNPICTACSPKPQVTVCTDLHKMKLKDFELKVLKDQLHMIEPDVQFDLSGDIILSSEEGETTHNNDKTLAELRLTDGIILLADDFVQNYKLTIIVRQRELGRDDPLFFIEGDVSGFKPKEERKENGNKSHGESSDKHLEQCDDDDDDVTLCLSSELELEESRKRKNDETPDALNESPDAIKKPRIED